MSPFHPKNTAFKEAIDAVLQKQNFMHHMGFEITKIEAGSIKGVLEFNDFLKQQSGFLHGGAIATICDVVCGLAAYSLLAAHEYVVTSDLKISYLNPGVGSIFIAHGWVIKAGSRMVFCEGEVYDAESNIMIAKASATMVIVPNEN